MAAQEPAHQVVRLFGASLPIAEGTATNFVHWQTRLSACSFPLAQNASVKIGDVWLVLRGGAELYTEGINVGAVPPCRSSR